MPFLGTAPLRKDSKSFDSFKRLASLRMLLNFTFSVDSSWLLVLLHDNYPVAIPSWAETLLWFLAWFMIFLDALFTIELPWKNILC